MAKLICAALALFLLFAFSHARTPSDVPDGLDGVSASTLRLLRLPSERHDPENVAEHKAVDQPEEEKVLEAEFATIMSHEENTADGSMSETIPLTVFSFESHSQFPRRPFHVGGGRHGRRHNCGHHHVQHKWSPRVHPENDEMDNENNAQVDTPNGGDNNDEMVSSSSSLADGIMKMDRGGGRARWTNFRHVGPRFPYEHNDVIDSELPHRHRHRHHPSHRHHDESELQNDAEEHHEKHKHEEEHGHEHEHEHEHHEHEYEHEHHEHEHEHEHHEHEHEHHEHEHDHEHEHEDEHEQEQGHGLFKGIRKFLNGF